MKLVQQRFVWFVVLVSLGFSSVPSQAFDLSEYFRFPLGAAEVADELPGGLQCKGNGKPLPMMNETVLGWKQSTRDQYMARALVRGPITSFFPDRNGHTHFGINLNSDGVADLEVIYNDHFGDLPKLSIGMMVIACGDYITVGPRAKLPSPLGAIIHWLHYNPGDRDGGKHPHGFLIINNQPYGIANKNRVRGGNY